MCTRETRLNVCSDVRAFFEYSDTRRVSTRKEAYNIHLQVLTDKFYVT